MTSTTTCCGSTRSSTDCRTKADPTHDDIARRAYELFQERGGEPGREWEDWFRAERQL